MLLQITHEDRIARRPAGARCRRPGPRRPRLTLGRCLAVVVLGWALAVPLRAAVRDIGAIGLTVGDLDRLLPFYTNTLPFELQRIVTGQGEEQDALLGLTGTRTRTAELRLGDECITLTEHLANKGRLIPPDSRSFDHWFQHLAIVVRDMDRAYEHLRRNKVKHVSTAPQTLPAWNRDAGGIQAFYFRDPEDHVLEIIWFPPGKGDPRWQRTGSEGGGPLFLGIDHTAIVVSDTEASLAFYRDLLGLSVAGGAENYGPEQEHLNQVFGARLRITALRAELGPGIEFLEYLAPPGGRPLPPEARANDLVFWHTRLAVDEWGDLVGRLRARPTTFVSKRPVRLDGDGARPGRSSGAGCARHTYSVLVRDPDGHALQLVGAGGSPLPGLPASNRAGKPVAHP